jgi:uncharacterized protein
MRFSEHRGATVLTVPGLGGSGPLHWQSLWERLRPDAARVELGMWNAPRRNLWVSKLDQAVRVAKSPVVLVAHSLGCLTVAWWAALATQPWGWPVAGALLVAPPDVGHDDLQNVAAEFGPHPKTMLPFPTIVVASSDDPYSPIERQFDMAKDWGAQFVDAGAAGHLNAASGIGEWHEGQSLLDRLIDAAEADSSPSKLAGVQALYDRAKAAMAARLRLRLVPGAAAGI